MNFEYKLESIDTNALKLDYFLVPWDTEIIQKPVADVADIEILDESLVLDDYRNFTDWCEREHIYLCSCRLGHDRIVETLFLEQQGFRLIELNYRPQLAGLQGLSLKNDEFEIVRAEHTDKHLLADIAVSIFQHGRFHQDPRIGPELGNKRYRAWMLNAFELPHQQVYKCMHDDNIAAFFVAEQPEQKHCFWSLVGMAPAYQGKGLAKSIWRHMLAMHQTEGIDTVSTSITSHNVPVFNLYVALGFRFPAPQSTFHWVR